MSELSRALIDLVLDEVRDLNLRGRDARAIVVSDAGLVGHILLRRVGTPGRVTPAIEIVISRKDWAAIEGDEHFRTAALRARARRTIEGHGAPGTLWGVPIEIEGPAVRREEFWRWRS